ncbi:hypothetical protein [Salibacterium aidingense]|uniref:hypothetical protein n=1 Tax=Salibacterium aidingense TaxID=384933 RepID=UPI0003FD139F|nr:hypothetical protein [Salibacterium aidingense]
MYKPRVSSEKSKKLAHHIDKTLQGAYAFGHKKEKDREETRRLVKNYIKNKS